MKNKPALWKMLTGGSILFFLVAVVFSFGISLTGCDNNMTSLEDVNTQEEENFFDLPYDPVELSKRDVNVIEVTTYTAVITAADGGVIFVDQVEALETFDGIERLDAVVETEETRDAFVIQANSIPYDVTFEFEVTKLVTLDGDMPIVYDCRPDGLVFSKPAILILNAWENFGKNTESVCFYYYNEQNSKWELLEQVPVDDNGIVATQSIAHFSRYGAGDPPKGRQSTDY